MSSINIFIQIRRVQQNKKTNKKSEVDVSYGWLGSETEEWRTLIANRALHLVHCHGMGFSAGLM